MIPEKYYPVVGDKRHSYQPIIVVDELRDDIYVHKHQDVRAIEFCEVDSIYKLFGNRSAEFFNGLEEGAIQVKQGGKFLYRGQWIVWRNDINVNILTPDQFRKEFFSPKRDI